MKKRPAINIPSFILLTKACQPSGGHGLFTDTLKPGGIFGSRPFQPKFWPIINAWFPDKYITVVIIHLWFATCDSRKKVRDLNSQLLN